MATVSTLIPVSGISNSDEEKKVGSFTINLELKTN